ncbi:MAG: hypothetical protein R2758_12365 [Bacteroidales bacterium]
MDYNKILASNLLTVHEYMEQFNITLAAPDMEVELDGMAVNIEKVKVKLEFYTYSTEEEVKELSHLKGWALHPLRK